MSDSAPRAIRHYDDLDSVFERLDVTHRRQVAASAPAGPDSQAGAVAMLVIDPDALDVTSKLPVSITAMGAVADDMYAAIARFGSPRGAEAETDALVDELVPGYRRGSAA